MTKKKSKLNLNSQKPKTPPGAKPVDLSELVGNCLLNISIALDKQAFYSEQIACELADIRDDMDRICKDKGLLTEVDIAEREGPEDDEPEKADAE